ncbi:hypothetical protein YDYSY3_57690 [Paenibacillus chitinolyticus]|uniref:hypothetical protein n=1 Tax=Paenibacillus chitinolyticus TaxID=79263 RepID=UPI0026E49D17|nr:hypothetical protein [Paenibacillus chitinolyticus]GKS14769.1 hypothetical protein YDYSY3_57690 [Paenibacillus chitinolyticus]
MAMIWGQGELFPEANDSEVQRTKFLLDKYKDMLILMADYEAYEKELAMVAVDGEVARRIDQDDLHADKTANAVILIEKQRRVYEQYKFYTRSIFRAYGLIRDPEAKRAIERRFIDGYSYSETMQFFQRSAYSESTVKRKIAEGTAKIANTLKLWGFFEKDVFDF